MSGTGGGRDRSELELFNPGAWAESDDPNKLMGCHTGDYIGLNLKNPDPGFHYIWADDTERGVLKARAQGYTPVTSDNQEQPGYAGTEDHPHQGIDSSHTGFPGVVLVRRSAQDERRARKEEQSRRDKLLRGGDTEANYRSRATATERQRGGTREMKSDHRTYATDGADPNSPSVDSWSPSRGIT